MIICQQMLAIGHYSSLWFRLAALLAPTRLSLEHIGGSLCDPLSTNTKQSFSAWLLMKSFSAWLLMKRGEGEMRLCSRAERLPGKESNYTGDCCLRAFLCWFHSECTVPFVPTDRSESERKTEWVKERERERERERDRQRDRETEKVCVPPYTHLHHSNLAATNRWLVK